MLQLSESIKKAIEAERDWSALEADRSLSSWVVGTLKNVSEERCQMTKNNRGPERDVEEHGLLEVERHLAERCRLRDVVVCVPTLRSLPDWRFDLVSDEKSINPGRGGGATGGARLVVGSMTGGKRTGVPAIQASCRPEDTWVFKACAPLFGRLRDNTIVAFKLLANLQEKEHLYEGIKDSSRRKVVAALRQIIEVDNNKALVWSPSSCWTSIVWEWWAPNSSGWTSKMPKSKKYHKGIP